MKSCPKCGAQMEDQAVFCANCGANYNNPYGAAAPVVPEWDHTAEFDPKDVSDNKVIAMLVYLLSVVGILIALLSQNSPYVSFHVRQALKFLVVETLVGKDYLFCFYLQGRSEGAGDYPQLYFLKIMDRQRS